MARAFRVSALPLLALLFAWGPSDAACPSADEILERLKDVDLRRASRTASFSVSPPQQLYARAAKRIGYPFMQRRRDKALAVILVELPVEALWKAVNDEDHHARGHDYLPVRHSEVIAGTPRGKSRLLFQYFQQMGIGRWWVSRVSMNAELYERSAGRLWEVVWKDAMDEIDPTEPPMNTISSRVAGIRESRGAWLLVPVADECTLVEHFSWSDPGGLAGVAQPLVLKRALGNAVRGLVRLAEDLLSVPHDGEQFMRPDGTPID